MIKFIKTKDKDNRFDITEIDMVVDGGTWPEVLGEFYRFLQACGYILPEEIIIVNGEVYSYGRHEDPLSHSEEDDA